MRAGGYAGPHLYVIASASLLVWSASKRIRPQKKVVSLMMPGQPGDMPQIPGQGVPPYGGYPAQGAQPYGYPAQSPYGAYSADPQAPFGRDPVTGEPLSDKSAVTAGVLQLFFGSFGVGRFYIGSTNIAVIQLVLGVLGVITSFILIGFVFLFAVGIWALVDAIMMFTRSVPDKYGRKLRS